MKASATVTASDFNGLRKLAGATGDRFVAGLVLYDGDVVIPFGAKLFGAPSPRLGVEQYRPFRATVFAVAPLCPWRASV